MGVTALRFSIVYRCTGQRELKLRALILRPDQAWAIVDRSGSAAHGDVFGFSDWFSGPIGHDFHITGTLSANREAVTGTLHSLLLGAGRAGTCDSGPLRFQASIAGALFKVPRPREITLTQYRAVPAGATAAAAQQRLGSPNDREIYQPAGVITTTIPSGVPGAGQTWLDYRWRGHQHRYFQFFFRGHRLLPGSPGRSIAST